ncbi:unnamed protein product [Ambrosiozyma monospora]|uniref:Unnamed protein product n=1 Tax=Ambrosiozyma monospora TaxID=43982 RepID=A0ACB5T5S7_AMBMO|nr:unnamed protein product [Ambrosiozyma monospora]
MLSTVSSFVPRSNFSNALKCLAKTADWFNEKLVSFVEGEEVQSNDGSFVEDEEKVFSYETIDNTDPERFVEFTNGESQCQFNTGLQKLFQTQPPPPPPP